MLRSPQPRQRLAAKRRRDRGITDEELAAAEGRRSARRAAPLRRDALLAAFGRAGIPTDGQRAYHSSGTSATTA